MCMSVSELHGQLTMPLNEIKNNDTNQQNVIFYDLDPSILKPYSESNPYHDLAISPSNEHVASSATEFVPPLTTPSGYFQEGAKEGFPVVEDSHWRCQNFEVACDLANPACNNCMTRPYPWTQNVAAGQNPQQTILPPPNELEVNAETLSLPLPNRITADQRDSIAHHVQSLGEANTDKLMMVDLRTADPAGAQLSSGTEARKHIYSGCKKKCDEQLPVCAKCQRLGEECEFPQCMHCITPNRPVWGLTPERKLVCTIALSCIIEAQ